MILRDVVAGKGSARLKKARRDTSRGANESHFRYTLLALVY